MSDPSVKRIVYSIQVLQDNKIYSMSSGPTLFTFNKIILEY